MSLSAEKRHQISAAEATSSYDRNPAAVARAIPAPLPTSDAAKPDPAVLLSVYNSFDEVESVWRAFEEDADCFAFQAFDWLSMWHKHIGSLRDVDLHIVVAWGPGGKPLMLLPLGIERYKVISKLVWLGDDIDDYSAPLLAPNFSQLISEEGFLKLWADIRGLLPAYDMARMMRQPAMIGSQRNPFMALKTSLNASGAHMTSLLPDFDTYYQEKRSKSAKKRDRNRKKKIESMGETSYVHPESEEEIRASVARLIEMKSESFKAMGVADMFARPGYKEFYTELAVQSGANGFAHASHLEVDGEIVSANWGIKFKGRYYYQLASYTGGEIARHAPGTLTLVETMRWASENGVEVFDFTIGDERYKREWCETDIDLHDHLTAETLAGATVLMVEKLALKAKRTIKQTPALWSLFTKVRKSVLAS